MDTLDSMSYNKESVVRVNHVYETVWKLVIGEPSAVNHEIDHLHASPKEFVKKLIAVTS